MRGRGGRGKVRRARRRVPSRRLLVAVPGVGLALILFAQAANNDLSSLRADAPPTTPVAGEKVADRATGSTPTTLDPAGSGRSPIDPGVSTADDLTATPPEAGPAATGPLDPTPLATGQAETGTTVRPPPDGAVTATTARADDLPATATTATTGGDLPGTAPATAAGGDGGGSDTGTGNPTGPEGGDEVAGAADQGSGIVGLIRTVLTAIAIAASVAGIIYLSASMIQGILLSRRRRADDGTVIDDEGGHLPPLVVIDPAVAHWTLEQLKARLEADPDPRSAVRHAYAAVESGFGAGGGLARRRTETPLQYLERTLGMIEDSVQPLRTLTGLFLLARYSNRPITESMRRVAIAAVVDLQTSYRQAEGVAV